MKSIARYLFATDDSAAQLCARLALGIVVFPHGAQKVFGWFGGPGWHQTLTTFAGLGFPPWSTVLLMITECLGALLLIVGLLTRVWALGLTISMAICMAMNHVQNGFFMNWFGTQKGEGFEYHLLVFGITAALILTGGGKFSIDRAIYRA
jgi:putative oxidoreductase